LGGLFGAGKNRFGVALADVAGKGLKAALMMVKLQATLRALAADFKSFAVF
jgi:serine phosphatase RsbU (regulator of sigma subunit)